MTRYISRHLLPAVLTAMFLAGCGGRENPQHSVAGFKDHEIVGIDISAHNGDVDFKKVREGGIEFVIIKASEAHSRTGSLSTMCATPEEPG